jgi:hypothetical protein
MTKFKISFCLCCFFFGTIILWTPPTFGQENFLVPIGKTKVFTEFNIHLAWFEDGDWGTPWPEIREASSEGNSAHVLLTAKPIPNSPRGGESGMAFAWAGVQFNWDLGQHKLEEVQYWPIRLTYNFSYVISAQWQPSNNSANALINYNNCSTERYGRNYDYIGHHIGTSGMRSNTVSVSYITTVSEIETMQRQIAMEAKCQAQSASITSDSYANLTIHSIKIEFVGKTSGLPWTMLLLD